MNKHILTLATVLTLIFFGGGCDYNEDNFEGLQDGTVATDVKRFDYTLTDEDYTAIANNKTNKTIASDAGGDAVAALKAIGTNKYFATPADAAAYIPAYLAANYPALDNTSAASVTYTYALDLPENVAAMNAMKEIKELDYTKVWGEGKGIEYLTPATESKLTDALPTEGLEAGDYVAVTYQYAETEPSTSEPDPDPAKPELTSVLGTAALDAAVEVTGYISALSSQGPILTDKGGSVLLYGNNATSHLKLGEIVKVSGTIAQFNNGFQIAADKATIEQTGKSETIAYPTPTELDGAAMDALLTTYYNEYHYAQFVKVKGTVSISGRYYNFNVAGAENATGSFYGITDEIKGKVEDGKEATLYGYFTSVSKSSGAPKFVNIVVTHVNEAPATEEPDPAKPQLTSVLGTAALDAAVDVTGYISALSSQGPILTDKGGSVLLYGNKATSHLKLGEIVKVSGTIAQFNNGFQIAADKATIEQTGKSETIAYPTPTELDGAAMDALLTTYYNEYHYAQFVKVKGTVSISGKYYNFNVAGAENATGSFYGITDEIKGKVEDGKEATLYGYFTSVSKSSGAPKFVNIVVTHVNEAPAVVKRAALALNTRAEVAVATEKRYAVYTWDGTKFNTTNNAVLQPSDYTAMGQNYGNFTNPDQDVYLPQFLAANYPYGKADDVKYVSYLCYKDKKTSWATDEYVFDGMQWAKRSYFETREDQFVKSKNLWNYDPSIVWVIEAGKNMHPATEFFQACVDWVKANVQNGSAYITSYGNNDYYSGASAYQGNLDWRVSAARGQYAEAFEGKSDDEVLKALQEHTAEVFAAVLPQFYPALAPIDGIDVTLTVQCAVYTGTTTYYNFVFKVVETGKYEFESFAPVE